MTRKELAKETLERKIQGMEMYKKYEDEKDLERSVETLVAQIHMVQEVNLINTIEMNEYLSRVEKKYLDVLHTEQFKEYREQVINMDDDYVSHRERLFNYAKIEKENAIRSKAQWEKVLNNTDTSGNSNHSEREEILKSVADEREEIREDDR